MESVITAAAMAAEKISTVVLTVSVVADTLVYVYQKKTKLNNGKETIVKQKDCDLLPRVGEIKYRRFSVQLL